MGDGSSLSQCGFTLRTAVKDDLDGITRIHIESFTEEPQVHYCYPFRHQYPEEHWKWTRKEYENYLEQPQKCVVHVLEAPSEVDGSIVVKLIGHAVLNIAVLTEAIENDPAEKERKDANKKRCEAFFGRAGQRFKTYFAKWAEKQVNLSSLVVHPNFRRRGGGTILVRWGITVAKGKGWLIVPEVVQVEGEEETLTSTVMVYGAGE